MNTNLIQAINRGGLTLADIGPKDMPAIEPSELKVIAFEVRCAALNASVVGLAAALRDCLAKRMEILAELNNVTRDVGTVHAANSVKLRGGKEAEHGYYELRVQALLEDLARSEALRKALQLEHDRLQAEWQPIVNIKEGMRLALDRAQARERHARAEARPPREKSAALLIAEAQAKTHTGPTDDLPGPLNSIARRDAQEAAGAAPARLPVADVTARLNPAPALAPQASGPEWLQRLQAKAYGAGDGE